MPRDLSDLMESAVSSAPPEKHLAGDITRAAEHSQRRRTTWVAAGAAAAVAVLAGVTIGLTQHHPSTPEPAHQPYLYDQTVDAGQAVAASSLPGYRLEPWTIPSVQPLGRGLLPSPTYHEVDQQGRLLVVRLTGQHDRAGADVQLYDAPGQPPRPLRVPPSPGINGTERTYWLPSFYGQDQLIWRPSAPIINASRNGFHLTDLSGGHDEFVRASFQVKNLGFSASADQVTDGTMWMTVYDSADVKTGTTTYVVYRGSFAGDVARVARDVAVLDVGDGIAGWVTTDGRVFVQEPSSPPKQVDVPLDPGCQVSPASWFQAVGAFAVSRSAIALTERCGQGKDQLDEILAFDLSGRALVRVTTRGTAFKPTFAGDALFFGSLADPQAKNAILRYDLVTGGLSSLSPPPGQRPLQDPQGAGDFVLWYDGQGGQVAEIPR
jgi:hypothetical protein